MRSDHPFGDLFPASPVDGKQHNPAARMLDFAVEAHVSASKFFFKYKTNTSQFGCLHFGPLIEVA